MTTETANIMDRMAKFDAYVQRLAAHDWSYEYSDDGRVYRAGQTERRALQDEMKNDLYLNQAFWAYIGYHFAQDGIQYDTQTRDRRVAEARAELAAELATQLITS